MYTVKLFVALLLTVTLVSAVDQDGFGAWPYCYSVNAQGTLTRDGDVISYVDLVSIDYVRGQSNAVFNNGLNLGLDSNGFWDNDISFLDATATGRNDTANPFPNNGSYWDFGITYFSSDSSPSFITYALVDGSLDTVDTAMAFTIDLIAMQFNASLNPTLTCSENGVAYQVDNAINALAVTQHFFVAKNYDSWARAVAVVTNPTGNDITAKLGFYNELGSDDDTVFLDIKPNYVVTADALNDTALLEYEDGLGDNPISIHWTSKGSAYALPLAEERSDLDYVNFYWENVTVKAGETQSFMMILVQNTYSVQQSLDNATYIDSNPLNIYQGLSSDILMTLQNFNVCAATAPIVTVTEITPCTTAGGEATLTIVDYDLSFAIVVYDNTGAELTIADDVVMVPEGDYMMVARLYPGCEVTLKTGSVTCPVAPTTAPGSNTPQASTPTSVPKSATNTATYNGVTAVAMSLIALASLL